MKTIQEMKEAIQQDKFIETFAMLYGEQKEMQKQRYMQAIETFHEHFPNNQEIEIYSAPGRSEVGGNHTDHQHGRVLAAGVNMDSIAIVAPTGDYSVHIISEGFHIQPITLEDLEKNEAEYGTSEALVRGVAAGMRTHGHRIGGFRAYITSDVLGGSGLSSSAAFEVLLGTIMNHLYNEGSIDMIEIAQISQYAENEYFGKPCGLLDQMACALGGFVFIDFKDTKVPVVEKVTYDFTKSGYALCIIDTKQDHADLTDEYAAIPKEMKQIAQYLGCDYLREVSFDEFLKKIPVLRELFGDRSVLRAMHFFREDERAQLETQALKQENFSVFLQLIKESGNSSYKFLQNVFSIKDLTHQGVSLAICMAEEILQGKGAVRVHGGGFAGTIQCFVPNEQLAEFKQRMELIFGEHSCHILSIRPCGGIKFA